MLIVTPPNEFARTNPSAPLSFSRTAFGPGKVQDLNSKSPSRSPTLVPSLEIPQPWLSHLVSPAEPVLLNPNTHAESQSPSPLP
mmetsp:Transcript_10452/g.16350  ORF Transcript_10452/g.16350 Transcript_10452/m.16350 type:complete len:84 (+) Transcript_10452:184-435(+)